MNVSYNVNLGGNTFVVSQECATDCEMFEFLHHMRELWEFNTCERNGQTSDKVRINVREVDENKYYEMTVFDPQNPECHNARRTFGVNKKGGGLFPKNKDKDGKWAPWRKWTGEKEE